ncbi:hypothetical protein PsYK624_087110 [Phanerochaete sordida]|uniref:Uncharacterized protein n=1 Tax=Phanerochaete sordida TaxID=48140 RepID=A0A9P3GCV1_9APHY|nr:hypothetical protein PsYK624_087110 [Phanerochaete sordida]
MLQRAIVEPPSDSLYTQWISIRTPSAYDSPYAGPEDRTYTCSLARVTWLLVRPSQGISTSALPQEHGEELKHA